VIKDIKRKTWVTRENFENMYENIYATMVESLKKNTKVSSAQLASHNHY
jgi:hypothetical protein